MKDIFEWIEKKYLSNKKQLEKTDKKKFWWINKKILFKKLEDYLINV